VQFVRRKVVGLEANWLVFDSIACSARREMAVHYLDLAKTPEFAQLSIDEKRFLKSNCRSENRAVKTRIAVMLDRARRKAEVAAKIRISAIPAKSSESSDGCSATAPK
jgi:hypothetical protein